MCSLLQNGFEKIINEFTSTISKFHFHETKTLKQQIEQQNAEITKLQLTCTDYDTAMQELKESISVLKTSNEDLKRKLLQKEQLLEKLRYNSVFEEEGENFEICEEETSYNEKRIGYQSFSYSSTPDPQLREKRKYSEVPNQVYLIIYII